MARLQECVKVVLTLGELLPQIPSVERNDRPSRVQEIRLGDRIRTVLRLIQLMDDAIGIQRGVLPDGAGPRVGPVGALLGVPLDIQVPPDGQGQFRRDGMDPVKGIVLPDEEGGVDLDTENMVDGLRHEFLSLVIQETERIVLGADIQFPLRRPPVGKPDGSLSEGGHQVIDLGRHAPVLLGSRTGQEASCQ